MYARHVYVARTVILSLAVVLPSSPRLSTHSGMLRSRRTRRPQSRMVGPQRSHSRTTAGILHLLQTFPIPSKADWRTDDTSI